MLSVGYACVYRTGGFNLVRLANASLFELWNDHERQIVPIAAFVAHLEVVVVDCNNAAIGQVAKGAGDGLAEVLLIEVSTVPWLKAPVMWPINSIMAPLMATPLATTWSVLALFGFALNVQV